MNYIKEFWKMQNISKEAKKPLFCFDRNKIFPVCYQGRIFYSGNKNL